MGVVLDDCLIYKFSIDKLHYVLQVFRLLSDNEIQVVMKTLGLLRYFWHPHDVRCITFFYCILK